MRRLAYAAAAMVAVVLPFSSVGSSCAADSGEERLPGELFRDCADCPELVIVPSGDFEMGSNAKPTEEPVHQVSIRKNFAIGRREVTFAEWDRCVAMSGCKFSPPDQGWGRGDRPVTDVSWDDAKEFTAWLSKTTGKTPIDCPPRRSGNTRPEGVDDSILVGKGRRDGARSMRRVRRRRDRQDRAHGLVPAECFRIVRHLGECGRVGGGLLESILPRRA